MKAAVCAVEGYCYSPPETESRGFGSFFFFFSFSFNQLKFFIFYRSARRFFRYSLALRTEEGRASSDYKTLHGRAARQARLSLASVDLEGVLKRAGLAAGQCIVTQ